MPMTEKEMEILAVISKMRFMNTSQIHRLYGYGGKYGDIVTRRKLRELEQKRLIKSWHPSKYEQKVFYLTKKGAEEVKLFYGYEDVSIFKKSDKTEHQVMISEIYVSLRHQRHVRLRRFILNQEVGSIFADAFIQLDLTKEDTKVLFLEADRATEGITHIRDEKLKGYLESYQSNWYQERFGIFPDVTFITTSDPRKRTLLNLAKQFPFKIRAFTLDEFLSNPMMII